ncbi:MAG: DUF4332 domain-containing protein, partial [Synergistaceae bacterium]|nr:DUF4332 domain-containing protein [Synergistaceae bacterium]
MIKGIGGANELLLKQAGIHSMKDLLEEGYSKIGRTEIARRSGISERLILKWVNHADLFRVKGIGDQYAEFLYAVGVDTVPKLAGKIPELLSSEMALINVTKRLVRRIPTIRQIENWIHQAG